MNTTMKTRLLLLFLPFVFFSPVMKAQLEKLIVETYYVSDANDATDTTDGRSVPVGSKTYRVYVDLKPGYKLQKIYGNAAHNMKIKSTANFYNNIDRPTVYYGYQVKKSYFLNNPTMALDSWLTLGLGVVVGTVPYSGVLKKQDTRDSTILRNNGGTALIAGGILKNNDPAADSMIYYYDGYLPYTGPVVNNWSDNGIRTSSGPPTSGTDTTVFGPQNTGSQFICKNCFLSNSGVSGLNPDSNQVLIAQLTTTGTLSLELNMDILDSTGSVIHYVAANAGGDTLLSPFLIYPTVCGCTDTRYLEYDPSFACSNPASCITLKRFGCTDSIACNYDPSANVLLPNFCCYPGYCNDRDISLVCPDLSPYKIKPNWAPNIYPNPVENVLTIGLIYTSNPVEITYTIYDAYGNLVGEKNLGILAGNSVIKVDVSDLPPGIYIFRVTAGGNSTTQKFIKN
jgi:hypothetical protein